MCVCVCVCVLYTTILYTRMQRHPTKGKPSFWKGLEVLINRTPRKTVANFLMFSVVFNGVAYVSESMFKDIINRFVTVSVYMISYDGSRCYQ